MGRSTSATNSSCSPPPRSIAFERSAEPPREGPALLQGRAVCGVCGSRMHVRYNSRRRGAARPQLRVLRAGADSSVIRLCQSILGGAIDAAIGTLLVEAVTPMALELALAVQQEIATRIDEADRLRHRQVERAQYEVDRARHRYMQVDPANRLVAELAGSRLEREAARSRRGRGGLSAPACRRSAGRRRDGTAADPGPRDRLPGRVA